MQKRLRMLLKWRWRKNYDIQREENTTGPNMGRLIEQLQEAERYLGSDVEIFIRDKDGIHQPQIVIERTPNELPVDKIVTLQ